MKIITRNVKKKETSCETYRNIGLNIKKPDKEEYIPAKIAREAVKLYRTSNISFDDIDKYIEKEMKNYPAISALTAVKQTERVKTIVGRYLTFDSRRFFDAYPQEFAFGCQTLRVKPDFWLRSREERIEFGKEEVDVVEVFSVYAGRPEFFDNSNRKGSVYHNLETCGNILYGKMLLNGKKGVVKVVYDYLKTTHDKHGDYSAPFTEAKKGYFAKSGENNRLVFTVPFDDNGEIVDIADPKLSKIINNYKISLAEYLNGKCAEDITKGTCEDCEYYSRCKGYSKRPEPKTEDLIEKKITRDDFDISDEQAAVIGFREGICCVDAGPGSGKTFSVSMRIADMIVEGENPKDFLCLSFSKAAVKVMKERVDWLLNDVYMMNYDTSKMSIYTFHGLANEIVNYYYEILGFSEVPKLIDDIEAIDLVKQAIDWDEPIDGFDYANPLMRFGTEGVVPNLYRLFTEIQAFNLDRAGFDVKYAGKDNDVRDKIWDTYVRYKELMKENNFIDFNDMEIIVEKLININPYYITDIFDFKHIVVDEFQDSNDFQMLFVNTLSLAESFKSLMVIGDEAQAIYGFRGTSPENFIHFDDKMGLDDVKDLNITINRRSTPEIVDVSNQIIALNKCSHKVMKTYNPSGEIPVFKDFEVGSAELPWIADKIKELILDGVNPSDIAFISHKKATLTKLQGILSEDKILALYDQPENLLTDSKVTAVISLTQFLKDNTSDKGVFDYLCELLGNEFMFDPDAQNRIEYESDFISALFSKLSEEEKKTCFLNLINRLRDESDNLFETFVERLEGKTSYSYSQLLDYIIKFDKYESDASAEKSGEYEAVALVTAHSSKGKEWKHVFVSLSDFDSSLISMDELPEKIRLMYVACTRAELTLTVTCCKYRRTEGDAKPINHFWRMLSGVNFFNLLKAS